MATPRLPQETSEVELSRGNYSNNDHFLQDIMKAESDQCPVLIPVSLAILLYMKVYGAYILNISQEAH